MEYYENIRRLRREHNLTQLQLAEKLQVSRQTVARWESGWNVPNFLSAQKMAQLFGVEVGELITGERTERPAAERPPEISSLVWFSALCAVSAVLFRILAVFLPDLRPALGGVFLCAFFMLAVWWGLKLYRLFYASADPYARRLGYQGWRRGWFFFGASLCAVLTGAFWESRFVPEIECFAIPFSGMFCYVFCDTLLNVLLRKAMVGGKNPFLWCDCVFLVASVSALAALAIAAGLSDGKSATIYFVVFLVLLGIFGCGYFLFRTLFFLIASRKKGE